MSNNINESFLRSPRNGSPWAKPQAPVLTGLVYLDEGPLIKYYGYANEGQFPFSDAELHAGFEGKQHFGVMEGFYVPVWNHDTQTLSLVVFTNSPYTPNVSVEYEGTFLTDGTDILVGLY